MKEYLPKKSKPIKAVPLFYVGGDTAFSSSIFALNEHMAEAKFPLLYTYHHYLRSPYWRTRRQLYVEHYKGHCQQCHRQFSNKLQLHHTTYENLRQEDIGDLQLLCQGCHYKVEYNKQG